MHDFYAEYAGSPRAVHISAQDHRRAETAGKLAPDRSDGGHGILPVDGRWMSPLVAAGSPHGGHRISPLFCPDGSVAQGALSTRRAWEAGLKNAEEVMEILEAFDLTGTLRGAAELAGCDHKTVAHWVAAREAAGGGLPVGVRARPRVDGFAVKIEEWVDRSRGRVRADRAHERLVAMGYMGSERTTRRAVARAKRQWRQEHGRRTRPWVTEPGLWMQWDYGDGPEVAGRSTVLFCAWLAWSRFRVVVPLWDRSIASVVLGLDRTLRRFGGAPTYAFYEYVPGHIFVVLCPTRLCGRQRDAARDHGDRQRGVAATGHITLARSARVLPLSIKGEEVISSGRRRSIGSGHRGSVRRSSGMSCGWPSAATRLGRCCGGCRC